MTDKQALKKVSIGAWSLLLIALIVWFFAPDDDKTHKRLKAVQSELKALRESVDQLSRQVARLSGEDQLPAASAGRGAGAAADDSERSSPTLGSAGGADAATAAGSARSPDGQAASGAAARVPPDPAALQVERADTEDPPH